MRSLSRSIYLWFFLLFGGFVTSWVFFKEKFFKLCSRYVIGKSRVMQHFTARMSCFGKVFDT